MPKATHRHVASRNERRQQALHRRRQQATARTAAARRAAKRRRAVKGTGIVVVLAAVIAGGVTLALRDGGGEPSRDLRAKKVSGAGGRLAIASSLPESYHAVYRAEAYAEGKTTASTEEVTIRRPFDGNVAIREGAPPGTTAQFQGRSTFGVYANLTAAASPQVAGDAPTVALGDTRVAAMLDDLVDQGLFVPGDRRRALGRECQTYRTGSPLQSLKIVAPTATDYVDVCLDDTGLILEEVAVAGGKLTQRLIATSLELNSPVDPADFVVEGERIGPDQGGAEVTEVDRTVAPAPGYWALDSPPAGFTLKGRYLVVAEGSSYVDVYVRGIDIVTVRQGAPTGEPDLSDAGASHDVDLGPLGGGQMIMRAIGPTLIAHPGADSFVHVDGTVSPSELQAVARALRRG